MFSKVHIETILNLQSKLPEKITSNTSTQIARSRLGTKRRIIIKLSTTKLLGEMLEIREELENASSKLDVLAFSQSAQLVQSFLKKSKSIPS